MRLLICVVVVSLIKISYGSFVHSGIARGLATKLYSPYQTFRARNFGFATHSVPFWTDYGAYLEAPCTQPLTHEIGADFRAIIYKFGSDLFKRAGAISDGHFVMSPHTAWLSLAALAEGTEGQIQDELFKLLSLPEDRCLRQIFYGLATTRESPNHDVILARNRVFVTDSSLQVNRNWEYIAQTNTHLNTVSLPFKTNPGEIEALKRIFQAQLLNIDLSGNSFLIESLDYHGLWSAAFSDAVIETGPFYNTIGEEIGTMKYMKIKKQVNIAFVPSVNMKLIELPVGLDERYKMMIAVALGNEEHTRYLSNINEDLLSETLGNLRPTSGPIEIVIPRLTMTSEIDIRKVLEGLEIDDLWTNPSATRNISEPAALPSSYIQRVTVTLDNNGIRPSIQEYYNIVPALPADADIENNSENLKNFIANRPFLFGIFDSELYTLLFAASFSKPSA